MEADDEAARMVLTKIRLPKFVLIIAVVIVLCAFAYFVGDADGKVSRADVIVAAATVLYTVLTGALLWATYSANRPIVTVYTERELDRIYLVVANNGNRPAAAVRLTFTEPILVDGRDLTQTTGIFLHPIGSIPAGGKISTGFGFGTMLFPTDRTEEDLVQDSASEGDTTTQGGGNDAGDAMSEPTPRTTLRADGSVSYVDPTNGWAYRLPVVLDARYLEGLTWFTSSRDRDLERNIRDSRNDLRAIRRVLESGASLTHRG